MIFRSAIDCAVKCRNVLGCTAFRHILESQTCQLGSLSNLVEASETDLDVLKIYTLELAKGSFAIRCIQCNFIKCVF